MYQCLIIHFITITCSLTIALFISQHPNVPKTVNGQKDDSEFVLPPPKPAPYKSSRGRRDVLGSVGSNEDAYRKPRAATIPSSSAPNSPSKTDTSMPPPLAPVTPRRNGQGIVSIYTFKYTWKLVSKLVYNSLHHFHSVYPFTVFNLHLYINIALRSL